MPARPQPPARTRPQAAFTVNRAMLLTRELRTHRELPPAPFQQARLATLTRDWAALRAAWRSG
ncbi:hypothetical protein [Streptomyces sp. NPDC008001]|uniref:hypothetical protein n=1 Tax=Streptomyces sp. NPDC008001 TaxID=3364804 RepID=UPI0036E57F3E